MNTSFCRRYKFQSLVLTLLIRGRIGSLFLNHFEIMNGMLGGREDTSDYTSFLIDLKRSRCDGYFSQIILKFNIHWKCFALSCFLLIWKISVAQFNLRSKKDTYGYQARHTFFTFANLCIKNYIIKIALSNQRVDKK